MGTPDIVEAHSHEATIRYRAYYPEHAPRRGDPYYREFRRARLRLQLAGKLVCWRCGAPTTPGAPIELHHNLVEWARQHGIDIARFDELHPEFDITDKESFLRWVNSEGNLLPLCPRCHRLDEGIHALPYPTWIAGRYWRRDLPRPAVVVRGEG